MRNFYDSGRNILLTRFCGVLNEQNLQTLNDAVAEFVQQHGKCHGLLDYTYVTSIDLSAFWVVQRAEKPSVVQGMTRVFVAPSDLNYAWCRMFQITQDLKHDGDKPYVVRTMQEAYDILGIDTESFTPLEDL